MKYLRVKIIIVQFQIIRWYIHRDFYLDASSSILNRKLEENDSNFSSLSGSTKSNR